MKFKENIENSDENQQHFGVNNMMATQPINKTIV